MTRCIKVALISVFMLGTALLLGYIISFADSSVTNYEIDELAMTIDVPTEIDVVTRGVKQSDILFQSGIFDYIDTMTDFRNNNLYLIGKDKDSTFRINVTMTEDSTSKSYKNFKTLTSGEKNAVMESIVAQDMVVACSIYETQFATYFESLLKYSENNNFYYIKQYYTVVNGQNINISIVSIGDDLSRDESNIILNIVDSAEFTVSEGQNSGRVSVGVAVTVILVLFALAFIVFAFTGNLKNYKSIISKVKTGLSHDNEVSGNGEDLIDPKEEEADDVIIMDFLATDEELEQRNKILSLEVSDNLEAVEESIDSDSDTDKVTEPLASETVSIDVDISSAEVAEADEDEELNPEIFSDDNTFFPEEADDFDNEKQIPSEDFETEGNAIDKSNCDDSTDDKPDISVEEEPVDIEAAIAYFQDDFESRKIRRDLIKEKNSKMKKKRLFGK